MVSEPGTPQEGLGTEKNIEVIRLVKAGDYTALLNIIKQQKNPDLACKVVINTIYQDASGSGMEKFHGLVKAFLSSPDSYKNAMKALILYSWRSHKLGERFWQNPEKPEEFLYIDRDGEVISFVGDLFQHESPEPQERVWDINNLYTYQVLTGPKKGQSFNYSERPVYTI